MLLYLHSSAGRAPVLVEAARGQTYAQAIWLSRRVKPKPLCGALGRCGRCRVRFAGEAPAACREETEFFSPEEIAEGWRLACRHKVGEEGGPIDIYLPDDEPGPPPAAPSANPGADKTFLGVDLGTTSIQWRCVSQRGEAIVQGAWLNPQIAAGPDVISRLRYSAQDDRRDQLSSLALEDLARILELSSGQGARPERLCVAGNSVMTHILLRYDLAGLSAAPYRLAGRGGEIISLPLPGGETPCVIPPLPSPFAGGDISAGVLAVQASGLEEPLILADLGTNAEIALLMPDKLYLASAPLGPAMEGIGPKNGQPAGPGAAIAFSLTKDGLAPRFYNDESGSFISATGYLSLLSLLLNLGLMDADGHFTDFAPPVARNVAREKIRGRDCLLINGDLALEASDVELLLKVKAAFRLALSRLLRAAGEPVIKNFVLAGAIGEYAKISDLINLGFIPRAYEHKIISGGNTSLDGACILARDPSRLAGLVRLCNEAAVIDLADDPSFLHDYLGEMTWR